MSTLKLIISCIFPYCSCVVILPCMLCIHFVNEIIAHKSYIKIILDSSKQQQITFTSFNTLMGSLVQMRQSSKKSMLYILSVSCMDENQAAFLPFSKKEYVGAGVLWQNESLYKIGLLEFIFVTPRNNKLRRFS